MANHVARTHRGDRSDPANTLSDLLATAVITPRNRYALRRIVASAGISPTDPMREISREHYVEDFLVNTSIQWAKAIATPGEGAMRRQMAWAALFKDTLHKYGVLVPAELHVLVKQEASDLWQKIDDTLRPLQESRLRAQKEASRQEAEAQHAANDFILEYPLEQDGSTMADMRDGFTWRYDFVEQVERARQRGLVTVEPADSNWPPGGDTVRLTKAGRQLFRKLHPVKILRGPCTKPHSFRPGQFGYWPGHSGAYVKTPGGAWQWVEAAGGFTAVLEASSSGRAASSQLRRMQARVQILRYQTYPDNTLAVVVAKGQVKATLRGLRAAKGITHIKRAALELHG